ncbi:MAG: hypothetical protein COZ49_01890 [Candidatus Yonathbacteria bacterium CG_4_10_14_3_um_filter_47_65]|uniref:Uncharacterized protein n=1 Tax=Candidatus Yonathbacteria bacterium CG_4_9_14_0_8_um_filter_46_47 TaxID=1975106 RepID=A0A2M8DA64_9BACT|nr:MAG: hypothetical protein COZ49_01890 [Candidatus Yonathbacteria bacterium CG_4_10_14_3_um_filter_47_65]PJB84052.1 MAG: hypothetical protein CO088_00240 [Candidatus Yonathbacteria bacterium CG_4_9_14_0_8_um_filter_46_47]
MLDLLGIGCSFFSFSKGGYRMEAMIGEYELSARSVSLRHRGYLEKFWFEEGRDSSFDASCRAALIVEGIGENVCPVDGEWVAFSIVGAIVATAARMNIVPPKEPNFHWRNEMAFHLWDALWHFVPENGNIINSTLLASLMRSFLPREHSSTPSRKTSWMSDFVYFWKTYSHPESFAGPVSRISRKSLIDGRRLSRRLPEEIIEPIKTIGNHVPYMLGIAVASVKRVDKI